MYRCGMGSSGLSWRTLYGFGRSMRSKEGWAYGGGIVVSDKDWFESWMFAVYVGMAPKR